MDLAGLEDLFEGSEQPVDAGMRVNGIRHALMRHAGERTSDNASTYAPKGLRLPETTQALAILAKIERAAHVKNTAAGLAGCHQLRTFGREHGWLGFD